MNYYEIKLLSRLNLEEFYQEWEHSTFPITTSILDVYTRVASPYPTGKGILIWQLKNCANGNIEQLVNKAIESKFKWVSIKVAERFGNYNGNLINEAVRELRRVNIDVYGWGYIYGDDPIREAESNAEIINRLDLSGYFIDAESEYKKSNMAPKARLYAQRLKDRTNKPLGLCSYRYPNYHREFPFQEFLEVCNFHAPQLYWIGANADNAPTLQINASYEQLKKIMDLPMVPIGVACSHPVGDKIWNPTIKQLENFRDYCQRMDLGYGYYNWDSAEKNLDWWKTL